MSVLPSTDARFLAAIDEHSTTSNITIDFLQSTISETPPPTHNSIQNPLGRPDAIHEGGTMKVYTFQDPRIPDEVRFHIVLRHEHIVPAISYERVRTGGDSFEHRLCLKLMHHSLDKELPIREEARIRKIIRDVLKGLHHMHCQGYYHNDIKPQNIFLDFEGNAYIGDLGSVTNTTATTRQPVTTLVSSSPALFIPYLSPHYMSPEALWGWTPRAANDFWALGITMLSIWLGQLPFDLTMNIETQVSYANMVSKVPPGVSHEARDFVELLFRADTDPTITIEQLMS
eukprot:PhF_6_TR7063/c1_g1_i6/m.10667